MRSEIMPPHLGTLFPERENVPPAAWRGMRRTACRPPKGSARYIVKAMVQVHLYPKESPVQARVRVFPNQKMA